MYFYTLLLDIIWVIISVNESGLLRVTQQFSELGHESRLSPVKPNDQRHNERTLSGFNPFSSLDTPAVPFNSPVKGTESEVKSRIFVFDLKQHIIS